MSDLELRFDSGVAALMGELTFATVPEMLEREAELLDKVEDELKVDLAQVSRGDSAGLALLVAWVRCAKQKNKSVRFLNVPSQLREMAKVSDLEEVLSLS